MGKEDLSNQKRQNAKKTWQKWEERSLHEYALAPKRDYSPNQFEPDPFKIYLQCIKDEKIKES